MTGCLKISVASAIKLLSVREVNERLALKAVRHASSSFDSSQLRVEFAKPADLKSKPPSDDLGFGKHFSDHMLTVRWTEKGGWEAPCITPFRPFQMHPAAKVLHYAQELFEGMKAYRGCDDKIRLFRPFHNMARLNASAERACLPTFDGQELVNCIRRLVQIDQEWVPHTESSSLYIRPTMIGVEPTLGVGAANVVDLFVILSPVGPYFTAGFKPISLLADPNYVRAWPGGCGFVKMGSNYAPTLWTQKMAEKEGCHQCLWLLGPDHEITEVGAMNVFAQIKKPDSSDVELVTPPLTSGCILPGVTRRSILELTREWDEFEVVERRITMPELLRARDEGRLLEFFGAGTAAIVSPIGNLKYCGKMEPLPTNQSESAVSARIKAAMSDIYYGKVQHPWALELENWGEQSKKEKERLSNYQDSISAHLKI